METDQGFDANIPVLKTADSYHLDRVRSDLRIALWIYAAIALFWAAMGTYFLL